MQELHNDWFPIRYPQKFFDTATAAQSIFYSECLADVNGDLAAMVVAKHVRLCSCDKEVRLRQPQLPMPSSLLSMFIIRPRFLGGLHVCILSHTLSWAPLYYVYPRGAQDQGILPPVFSELDNRRVTYILTIGVDNKFRRKGIGQLLIANLVQVVMASHEQIHVSASAPNSFKTESYPIRF